MQTLIGASIREEQFSVVDVHPKGNVRWLSTTVSEQIWIHLWDCRHVKMSLLGVIMRTWHSAVPPGCCVKNSFKADGECQIRSSKRQITRNVQLGHKSGKKQPRTNTIVFCSLKMSSASWKALSFSWTLSKQKQGFFCRGERRLERIIRKGDSTRRNTCAFFLSWVGRKKAPLVVGYFPEFSVSCRYLHPNCKPWVCVKLPANWLSMVCRVSRSLGWAFRHCGMSPQGVCTFGVASSFFCSVLWTPEFGLYTKLIQGSAEESCESRSPTESDKLPVPRR